MSERRSPSGAHSAYTGLSGRTNVETTHIGCECGVAFAISVHRSIHVPDNPELVDQFFRGELDRGQCPNCGRDHIPEFPRVFHDPRVPALVLDLPREFRHRELELTAELLRKLDKEGADIPAYAKRPAIVYGAQALRDFLTNPEVRDVASPAELERQQHELQANAAALERHQAEVSALEQALKQQREELSQRLEVIQRDREKLRALASDLTTTASGHERIETGCLTRYAERNLPPERPQAEVDRWRASDAMTCVLVEAESVFVLARPGLTLADYLADVPRIRVQLHELDGIPLVALVASRREAERRDASSIYWPLDIRSPRDRAILEQLSEAFRLTLDLYDDESRPAGSWSIEAPLAENTALALRRADDMLARLNSREDDMAFDAVSAAFNALGIERFGHVDPPLNRESFSRLLTPGAARGAMSIVEYWSAPRLEAELLLNESFPSVFWRQIQQRVVEAAVSFGLILSPTVEAIALARYPSRKALFQELLLAFAQVCVGARPNDLDPMQEWSNWRALLIQCQEEGVDVGAAEHQLAHAAAWRASQLMVVQPEMKAGPMRVRQVAATKELSLQDILEEEELEDDAIVGESILAYDSEDNPRLAQDDDDSLYDETVYDETEGVLGQTLEISEEDIIERSTERDKEVNE